MREYSETAPASTPCRHLITPSFYKRLCLTSHSLGTFQLEYEDIVLSTHSASSIAWISTFQLFLMFFMSQPVGLLVDMYGIQLVLIPALLLEVGGLIALSFSTKYWQIFLAQGVCFGIGAATAFMPGKRLDFMADYTMLTTSRFGSYWSVLQEKPGARNWYRGKWIVLRYANHRAIAFQNQN